MNPDFDQAVFGTTQTRAQALGLVQKLRTSGFQQSQISLLMGKDGADDDWDLSHGETALDRDRDNAMAENVATGAGAGAIIGGALGWMAGVGALAIPGLGPFIAAGPILATLGGAAVGGTTGGLAGSLMTLGLSEHEANQYETLLREGRALVSVRVSNSDEIERAKRIFQESHADNISVQSTAHAM